MFSCLIDKVKREISSRMRNANEQNDESFVHLKSWRPNGSDERIDVSQDVSLFNAPRESARLNFSFWLKSPRPNRHEQDFAYHYKVSLSFDNCGSGETSQRYVYKVSFHSSRTRNYARASEWDRLLEREVIRTKNVVEFDGDFTSRQLYLGQSFEYFINCHLYAYVRRYSSRSNFFEEVEQAENRRDFVAELTRLVRDYGTIRAPEYDARANEAKEVESRLQGKMFQMEMKGTNALNGNVDDRTRTFQSKLTSHSLDAVENPKGMKYSTCSVRSLVQRFEKQDESANAPKERIERFEIKVEDQRRHCEVSTTKNPNLILRAAESKANPRQLEEIEHNLLAQLQDTEQRVETEMGELAEPLICCVCCVNQVDVVWIPCGHARFCDECVKDNQRRRVQSNVCMICRQPGESHKLIL